MLEKDHVRRLLDGSMLSDRVRKKFRFDEANNMTFEQQAKSILDWAYSKEAERMEVRLRIAGEMAFKERVLRRLNKHEPKTGDR